MVDRKRILIIDDEENFTEMVKLNLEEHGNYEVITETDAVHSLSTVLHYRPDLIFLDVIMPGMEGPDVFAQLQRNDEVKDTPVVFLTATVTKEEVDSQNGIIGGHPFLAKPGSVAEMIECIERNLSWVN